MDEPMTTSRIDQRSGSGRAGRIILTVALVVTPIAMVIFLFNGDHVFNTAWHPHARFHAAQLACIGVAISILGLWLLWRRNYSITGAIAAAVITAAPPLAEFAALLVPGTSPIPDAARPNTLTFAGLEVPGNLIAFAAMLVLIAIGLTLSLRAIRATPQSS